MDTAVAERQTLNLSQAELVEITNGLTQPAAQLRALHELGFVRASRPRGGPVALSRAHYLAVEEQRAAAPAAEAQNQPPSAAGIAVDLQAWASSRRTRGPQTQGR